MATNFWRLTAAILLLVGAAILWWVAGPGEDDSRATQVGALFGVVSVLGMVLPMAITMHRRASASEQEGQPPSPLGLARPALTQRFASREVEVQELLDLLMSPGPVAVTGPPGVGKTQLALAIAQNYEKEGRAVAWIRASSNEQLREDLVSLGGVDRPQDPLATWCESNPGALVVIDGVEDRALLANLALPLNHATLATLHEPMHEWTKSISLGNWSQSDAVAFVRRYAAQSDEVEDLVRTLGANPLLLDQAISFMADAAITPRQYLEALKEATTIGGAQRTALEPTRLSQVIGLTLAHAAQLDRRLPERFWALCAMRGDGKISRALTGEVWQVSTLGASKGRNAEHLRELTRLQRMGLVSLTAENVFIHAHIGTVGLELAPTRARARAIYLASQALEKHLSATGSPGPHLLSDWVGNVMTLASYAESLTPSTWPWKFNWPLWMARLNSASALARIAEALANRGDLALALDPANRAFGLAQDAFPYAMAFYPPEAGTGLRTIGYCARVAAEVNIMCGAPEAALSLTDWTLERLSFKRWNLLPLRFPLRASRVVALLQLGRFAEAQKAIEIAEQERGLRRIPEFQDLLVQLRSEVDQGIAGSQGEAEAKITKASNRAAMPGVNGAPWVDPEPREG